MSYNEKRNGYMVRSIIDVTEIDIYEANITHICAGWNQFQFIVDTSQMSHLYE